MVDVSGSSFAYYELMKEMWDARETFVVVEHDVLPADSLGREMSDCSED